MLYKTDESMRRRQCSLPQDVFDLLLLNYRPLGLAGKACCRRAFFETVTFKLSSSGGVGYSWPCTSSLSGVGRSSRARPVHKPILHLDN